MKACENCQYWTVDRSDGSEGECRRSAPTTIHLIAMSVLLEKISGTPYEPDQGDEWLNLKAYWPRTDSDDWCGEFFRKPPSVVKKPL